MDDSRFLEIYRAHQNTVFRFAMQMSGSRSAAEDITQEVFVFLIQSPNAFDPSKGTMQSFLLGVARNHVLRALRKQPGPEIDEDPADPAGDVLNRLLKEERVSLIRKAILCLPLEYRETVVLCQLLEMTYEEAAAVLGCAVGTIRSRLHRGRSLLSRKLGVEKQEGGKYAAV